MCVLSLKFFKFFNRKNISWHKILKIQDRKQKTLSKLDSKKGWQGAFLKFEQSKYQL